MLKWNAYHVLGLPTTATQRQALKRAKDINNQLKVGITPTFPEDLSFYQEFRTETTVKEAIEILQHPKKRIIAYFFWFSKKLTCMSKFTKR